jgi:hypothetical protein
MNRIQNTIISVCLLALAACQSDELQVPDTEACTLEILTSTEHATRTALLEDGKTVVWEQGDAIAVYDYIAPKKKFVAEVSEGTTRFKGNITPKNSSFLAVYPHDLCEDELQSQKVAINLPSEQTAVPGGFAPNTNLSIGKGERNLDGSPSQVTFRNICQLFKLQVPSYIDGRITKIVLATNKAIAGKLLVDCSGSAPSVAVDNQESTSVTLLPPAGSTTFAEGTYYMAVAPVQAEGFSLTMTDTNGKTYSQHSKQAFGGTSGVIYTLGALDLVEQPAITAQHVYASGVLQGTEVSLTAPVPDREWTATITNASGVTVRSLAKSAGTLKSAATDAAWPYLPKGSYTVNYTFLTANGKEMGSSVSFQITENPEFGLFQQAASSYTYYAGDEVEKNVTRANSIEAFTVTAISSSVTGISEAILNNANYSITYTNDFSGSVTASSNSAVTYADKKYSATGAYTLGATATFDGVTKSDTKSVHITGLPYSAVPPKEGDWSGKANDWTYSKNSHQGVRLYDQQISKSFNIPANVDVNVKQDVDVHTSTVGTTYTLYAGGNSIFSLEAGGKAASENCHEDKGTYPGTLTVDNPSVACDNSYGNAPFFETYGTHLLIREITVRYR